jgi:hypothetical protein
MEHSDVWKLASQNVPRGTLTGHSHCIVLHVERSRALMFHVEHYIGAQIEVAIEKLRTR